MRREWALFSVFERVLLVRRADLRPAEAARAIASGLAGSRVDHWFPGFREHDPLARATLIELCAEALGDPLHDAAMRSTDALRRRVREGLESGVLAAVTIPPPKAIGRATRSSAAAVAEPASSSPPPPEKKKGWIEIELLADDGTPLAGEPYRLVLPNGSVEEGKLDSSGRVRVAELDDGSCELSLPGFGARA